MSERLEDRLIKVAKLELILAKLDGDLEICMSKVLGGYRSTDVQLRTLLCDLSNEWRNKCHRSPTAREDFKPLLDELKVTYGLPPHELIGAAQVCIADSAPIRKNSEGVRL